MTQMGGEAIRSSDFLTRPEMAGQRADHMEGKDFSERNKKEITLISNGTWETDKGGRANGSRTWLWLLVPRHGLPGKFARPTTNTRQLVRILSPSTI
ncbi:hypothetical protein BDQ94DRAFT_137881 [Aspergillus welwitschiae]|uniref:Uncharacterized protein n=1 Tax=Aspergillus welwitschiae TaxID=1341132 RepID=A0A3F3QCG3_9EURO|nr:hypothetical protein BDQ94DRAFT_137881 [Aspergillus welwitschiae]RDH36492.1 hypothetical protein BDQ94DRAFT_137881 [Aspergillus welwitschiae]